MKNLRSTGSRQEAVESVLKSLWWEWFEKHLKNVGPIRHCKPRTPHCHSPGVATVARRLCIDVHNNDDDNSWQRGPLWPHRMGPKIGYKPGVKDKSYGWWKRKWNTNSGNDGSWKRRTRGGMRLMQQRRKLVPETWWSKLKSAISNQFTSTAQNIAPYNAIHLLAYLVYAIVTSRPADHLHYNTIQHKLDLFGEA